MEKKIVIAAVTLLSLLIMVISCKSSKHAIINSDAEKVAFNKTEGDTIRISGDKTEYEILIIEPGFNYWLQSVAKPEGYYSQFFMENRNKIYVTEWNNRVLQPMRYNPNLYEMQINYEARIDYGYEVNYKLYNYFIYFQRKYKQTLGPFVPRV